MKIKQKIAAVGVGVALLGGGSAVAMAFSDASSAAPGQTAQAGPPAGQPGEAKGRRPGAQLMGRVVHGDLIVRAKDGFEKVTYDRGTVTAKSGDSFTLQRPDNVTVTIKVTGATKYKGIQSFDQLEVNKPAIVLSKDGTAVNVGQRTDSQGKQRPARPGANPAAATEDPLI